MKELQLAIYSMSAEQRELATVTLNKWGWPLELENLKPSGFDDMTDAEKYRDKAFRFLTDELHKWVSPKASSWAWWKSEVEDARPERHCEWWANFTGEKPTE